VSMHMDGCTHRLTHVKHCRQTEDKLVVTGSLGYKQCSPMKASSA